jgi:elongation factor Ts
MFYPVRSIHSYVHHQRVGVLAEFGLETDFAQRTDEFARLAQDILLHIAAMAPADVTELLVQPFVKQTQLTIGEMLDEVAEQLRERLAVLRFVRWDIESPRREDADPQPPGPPAAAARLRVVR